MSTTPEFHPEKPKRPQEPRERAPSPFTAIERVNRPVQVRAQLEEAIRRGDYAPGDQLPSERRLSEVLGVSRVSIREAISALEAIGLVDVQQGRGCFVTDGHADDYAGTLGKWLGNHRAEVMELLMVRGALDELAAEEAARRAGPDEMQAIEQAQEAFSEAAVHRDVDVDHLERLDIEFHESLAKAAQSPLLFDLLHDLNRQLSPSRKAALALERRRPQAAAEHGQIVQAIKDRIPGSARAHARTHLDATRAALEASTNP